MIGSNMLKGIALASALALGSACAGVKKTTTDINPAKHCDDSATRDCAPARNLEFPRVL